jgi:hypothetical protein
MRLDGWMCSWGRPVRPAALDGPQQLGAQCRPLALEKSRMNPIPSAIVLTALAVTTTASAKKY